MQRSRRTRYCERLRQLSSAAPFLMQAGLGNAALDTGAPEAVRRIGTRAAPALASLTAQGLHGDGRPSHDWLCGTSISLVGHDSTSGS